MDLKVRVIRIGKSERGMSDDDDDVPFETSTVTL